jgi:hypothetical protein
MLYPGTAVRRFALLVVTLVLAACGDRPPTPPDGAPLTHMLVDDFAGSAVDGTKWSFFRGDATRVTQDNRLVVAGEAGVEGYWGLIYRLPHRFVGTTFYAEVSQAASGIATTETIVSVSALDEQEFVIIPSLGGRIGAWYRWRNRPCNDPAHERTIRGVAYCQAGPDLAFDPANHRFRRLREQGGFVFFELSADGVNWGQPSGWSIEHRFTDTGQLHGLIGVGTFSPDPNPGSAVFENVNTNVPAIPRELAATKPTATEVRLTWQDRSVNETGFRIERRQGTAAFAEIGTAGANVTTFTSGGLQAGATYEFRIRATNANGNSGYSRAVSVTM